jgi:hypothetical protein
MTKFEQFELKFKETYNDIYDFMYNYTINQQKPLLFEEKENNDAIYHDSYGNENSTLERVFYFSDYEIYVKFKGTRQSYSGEEWENMKEVKPVQKIINTFE